MIEQKYIQTAIDYKKNVAGKFVLVEGAKLKQRIDGERFAVTRKIDGHMQVVFFVDGQVTEQREPSSSLAIWIRYRRFIASILRFVKMVISYTAGANRTNARMVWVLTTKTAFGFVYVVWKNVLD